MESQRDEIGALVFTRRLKVLKVIWDATLNGQQTGLATPTLRNPFDQAILKGEWNADKFAQHGGKIPILGGAPGSRGIPEQWPHARSSWVQVGHGNWKNIEPNSTHARETQGKPNPLNKKITRTHVSAVMRP